jgi:hypothetical protein
MRCTRDTGFVALDMTVENIRCRVHRDLRCTLFPIFVSFSVEWMKKELL